MIVCWKCRSENTRSFDLQQLVVAIKWQGYECLDCGYVGAKLVKKTPAPREK